MFKVLFLGTGTSTGIPVIGCTCEVCQSDNPHNKRLRSSILITSPTTTLLVDSSPDLRAQALRHHITHIDAILYTHAHLDHVAGFDELRAFCWERKDKLPLYAGSETLDQLKQMYSWAFAESNTYQGYIRPAAHDHAGENFRVGDIDITPLRVSHATVECYGYLFRHQGASFAYLPDVKTLPEETMKQLQGLQAIAMDGLGPFSHPTHLSVEENIAYMQKLQPEHGYLTHCGHRLNAESMAKELPPFMSAAYDGLHIELRGKNLD